MTRSFRAKIPVSSWLLLAVLVFVTGYTAWRKEAVLLVMALFIITILIERIIHTEYILDNERLTIRKGRFSRPQTVMLTDIMSIEEGCGMRIGGKPLSTFLVIILQEGGEVIVSPKDQDKFIEQIFKQRYRNENE